MNSALSVYSDTSTDVESDEEHNHPQNTSSLDCLLELSYSEGVQSLGESLLDPRDLTPQKGETSQHPEVATLDDRKFEGCEHADQSHQGHTPKSGNTTKIDSVGDDCGEYSAEIDLVDEFLQNHHEFRLTVDDSGDRMGGNLANDENSKNASAMIGDYLKYMQTNAASPNAIRHTFLYCLKTDDVELTDTILRDVGIEYVLRHCLLYDGTFTTVSETNKNESTNTTQTSSANMFWLAAFHGSAEVLNLLIEECWIYFVQEETGGVVEPSKEVEKRADDHISMLMNKDVSVYGCTPMFIAASQNHADVIKVLLHYHVDPNDANSSGTTAAILAASRDNLLALEALAECDKTDFNKANTSGTTPLLAACQYGAVESVRFLTHLKNDDQEPLVNCKIPDARGFGCTALAARYNQEKVVQFLCQVHSPDDKFGVNINQRTEHRDTALHIAVEHNCEATVCSILQMIPRDIDPHIRNKDGMSALHVACAKSDVQDNLNIVKEFVTALKDEVKDLDTVDTNGKTPLFYAAQKGKKEIVALLAPLSDINRMCSIPILRRFDRKDKLQDDNSHINASNNRKPAIAQKTALIAAINKGHVDVVYALLYYDANLNQTDHRGYTALSHAAKSGNLEIVEILVSHGADPKIRSKGGRLPIHKARAEKHYEVAEYLEKCSK